MLQFCAAFASAQTAAASTAAGSLRGQVTDPSGAAIPQADVVLTPSAASAALIKTQSDGQGAYEFKTLTPGQYSLTVAAQGFSLYENDNIVIAASQPLRLNVAMKIEVEQEKIQVSDTVPTVDVNPANNAGSYRNLRQGTRRSARRSRTNCSPTSRLWLAHPPAPMAVRCISTASPQASFLRNLRSAKFALIPIPSPPSMTSWVTAASKFSPSPAPTSFTASSWLTATTLRSTRTTPSPGRKPGTTLCNTTATSAARSTRSRLFS